MELSKIKKSDILLKCNKNDIERIVFDETNIELREKCDVGIIFGGVSMLPHRVDQAIANYKKGLISQILVSGGIGFLNIDRKNPEAYKMMDYLLKNGISKNDILVEDKSRNTFENIGYSLEILKKMYDIDKINLALITSDFHVRRCIGLMNKAVKNDNIYGSGVKDGKTDINSWTSSIYGRRIILQEALLLCNYVKQQRINDIDIQGLSLEKK